MASDRAMGTPRPSMGSAAPSYAFRPYAVANGWSAMSVVLGVAGAVLVLPPAPFGVLPSVALALAGFATAGRGERRRKRCSWLGGRGAARFGRASSFAVLLAALATVMVATTA